MGTRFVFKVGPANRHSGYASQVTVIADTHSEARHKAIALVGYAPRDSSVWFITADEIDPSTAILERLDKLEQMIKEDKRE